MPGAYAHISLTNIVKEPNRLESIQGFPNDAISAVLDYFKFCELGAVSPDYPYLAIKDKNAAKWADTMHYTKTGQMIHAGIKQLRKLKDETQRKCLAWLLGYSAHVTTDVTIHPVVELKVGPYKGNETHHRICEMNQDAYIFQRLNLGEIGLSEHLDSGIAACNDHKRKHQMDHDIEILWRSMLKEVHPAKFKANVPDIHNWHKSFRIMLDDLGEEGNKLWPFARHVAAGLGLTYPAVSDIDKQYIDNLRTPIGNQHYDIIFDDAIKNVGTVWQIVASGVLTGSDDYLVKIGDWNLDTGKNENDQLVFWE